MLVDFVCENEQIVAGANSEMDSIPAWKIPFPELPGIEYQRRVRVVLTRSGRALQRYQAAKRGDEGRTASTASKVFT
jgi:hypothetical protein